MDSLSNNYQEIIEKVIADYADFLGEDENVQIELVFDKSRDRYILVETGWENGRRIYGTLLHLDIINGKIWIQQDGTEQGIATELVALGVPKERIVLGFKSLQRRQITEFAVS
jgi:hypothetical protein